MRSDGLEFRTFSDRFEQSNIISKICKIRYEFNQSNLSFRRKKKEWINPSFSMLRMNKLK